MRRNLLYLVFGLILFTSGTINDKSVSRLENGFKNPPMEARPRAYWCWVEGNFDLKQMDYELKQAYEKGMGGFDIWNVGSVMDEKNMVPKGPAFMGEESISAIAHAVNEATKYGLNIGLVLSSGWNSGGSWTKPENQTMGMYTSTAVVDGGSKTQVHLPFPKWGDTQSIIPKDAKGKPLFFQDIKILAYPVSKDSVIKSVKDVIEISEKPDMADNIKISLPKGKWLVVRHLCLNTGQPMILHSKSAAGPMIDHLSAIAAEEQIKFFAEKLQKKLGTFDGKALKYFYNDSYEVNGHLWTPTFIDEFKKTIGYDMTPYLPILYGYKLASKDTLNRFLFDYRKVLSDLIIENHYVKSREVCEKYGLGYVAEAAGPGLPLHNCPFESIKSSGVLTFPRGEFWYNHQNKIPAEEIDNLQIVKGVASASHIYDRKIVEAEAFTSTSLWQEAPGDLKSTADRAFCEGLNRVFFHVFSHSAKSGGNPGYVYAFGTQINTTRTWWNMSQDFMAYLGRTSFLLQQGNFVGDVLYYYGDDAPNFVPQRKLKASLGFGYDYDYINTDVLLNKLSVKDGKLALPNGQTYQVLVLPDGDVFNLEVLKKLETLVSNGATIIGKKPTKAQGLYQYQERETDIQALAAKIWQNIDGKEITSVNYGKGKIYYGLSEKNVLAQMTVTPDFKPIGIDDPNKLDYIHRTTDEGEVYFVRNKTDNAISCDAVFRVANKMPEYWNPLTGTVSECVVYENNTQSTKLPLNLEKQGSVFVVFRNAVAKKHITNLIIDTENYFPLLNTSVERKVTIDFADNKLYTSENGKYVAAFSNGSKKSFVVQRSQKPLEIKSAWTVTFPLSSGIKEEKYTTLNSWTTSSNDEIKYFSGIASYSNEFKLPTNFNKSKSKITLNLGEVYKIAHVYINGNDAGVCWAAPFTLDISNYAKPGKNEVKIEVANLEPNGMMGDAKLPIEKRKYSSNVQRLPNGWAFPIETLPNDEYPLLISGLLGPVTISIKKELID